MKHKLFLRRIFASLLLCAVSTLSWAYDFKVDGIYYNISGQNATVTKGDAAYSGTIVIPSTVKYGDLTYSVNKIDEGAFSKCSDMVSLTIPKTIEYLGNNAFTGCAGKLYINCDIPDYRMWLPMNGWMEGVAYLGPFVGSGFTEIVIGDDATSIGSYAFMDSEHLKSVKIGKNVTAIAPWSGDIFEGSKPLTSIFSGCNSLTSINVVSGNPKYDSRNDCNAIIETATNTLVIGCNTTIIPESVTSVAPDAFSNCTNLHVIDNLRYAGAYLVEVTDKSQSTYNIKAGTKFIGYSAFSDCCNLISITIPESVKGIGELAFSGCSSLTSIIIPNSVTSIGYNAFENCSSLTSVTIPKSVTSIGYNAFSGCSSLTSIIIPNSVTSIGQYAFSGCSGLTSVIIGNSVASIGQYAFSGCSGLASVTIPESVTSIGLRAFYGCSGLTSVTLNSDAVVSKSYLYQLNIVSLFGSQVKEYIIGNEVTSIGKDAFTYSSDLTSVTIPESVTAIEEEAFLGCRNLASITIPSRVMSIGNKAFAGCGLQKTIINSSVLVSSNHDLDKCGFSGELVIGNSVTTIGKSAFSYCSKLTSVTIPESVTSIGNGAFHKCSGLTSVTIPESVTSIGDGAFYECSGLTSVTIPESVTDIDNSTFSGCSGLTSVSIGNGVTSIGDGAFYECTGLTSITIPESVTSIGNSAFWGCSSLTSVTCLAENVPATGSSVFYDVPQSTVILYVPEISVNAYKSAAQWKEFGNIIGIDPTAVEELKSKKTLKANDNAPIYDLMGRRLQQKPANGYYIQGGKKYYVK